MTVSQTLKHETTSHVLWRGGSQYIHSGLSDEDISSGSYNFKATESLSRRGYDSFGNLWKIV